MNSRSTAVTLLALLATAAPAQFGGEARPLKFDDVVTKIDARFEPATAKPGDTVTWKLTLELIPGWHTYPTRQPDPNAESYTNSIQPPKTGGVEFLGQVTEPSDPVKKSEPVLDIAEYHTYYTSATWEWKAKVLPTAKAGEQIIEVPIKVSVCKESCLPPQKVTTKAKLTITGAPTEVPAEVPPVDPAEMPPVVPSEVPPTPPTPPRIQPTLTASPSAAAVNNHRDSLRNVLERLEKQKAPANVGLWQLILKAAFWGGVSLLTPCVFPMIPVTVSFFLKQAEKQHTNPVVMASVYCGTIVIVLGVASLTLLSFFTKLSTSPWMNLFLGGLFITLALSLFGMYELTLPSWLSNYTSQKQGAGGYTGTVFMALTFTIVSFTCVAPFLGGFGGMAASGQFQTWELIIGALTFALTFASPFFVLALFPSLMKALPKSGGWLHTVKVVMGFVELAAALKFLRTAELILTREPQLLTYDFVLAGWVGICVVTGLYLLGMFRIGDEPAEGVSVSRMMWGLTFVSLGVYLVPALFAFGPEGEKQRPRGVVYAWIDSFLLPDPGQSGHRDLKWSGDLEAAIEQAQRTNSLVFVDFTGETCTNCKLNERTVFNRSEIQDELRKYRLVKLYTDKVADDLYPIEVRSKFVGTQRQQDDADANRWFQEQAFGSLQLPLYIVLKPEADGRIVTMDIYDEGKINNIAGFANFLRRPLARPGA